MMQMLLNRPAHLATSLASDLVRRNQAIDEASIDDLRQQLEMSIASAVYSTKAKALLTRPLRKRKIDADGQDWKSCVVKLYGLWQGIRPAEVERRMAELRESGKNAWRETFPDDWVIDEAKLLALYKSLGPLMANGAHGWSDGSLALRFYVAEMLAPISAGRGTFDWGGSDGISSIFFHHHGAKKVALIEPNAAARGFGEWLSRQLEFEHMEFYENPPADRQYGAGICTEVLEHVVNPPLMMRQMFEMLLPGGVVFVTSSFGVPQDSHLKQNLKYAGQEATLMREAGFTAWNPPVRPPLPMLPQWGFWQRPAA